MLKYFIILKKSSERKGYNTAVGDEGGFAPDLKSNEEALQVILEAIENAGYKAGEDILICLDAAIVNSMIKKKDYIYYSENKQLTAEEMVDYYAELGKKYPIISIEDGLDENDWDGWKIMTESLVTKFSWLVMTFL